MQIAVLGAGAWGTALAISFAHRHSVSLWARDPEKAARMQAAGENSRYLPGHRFPGRAIAFLFRCGRRLIFRQPARMPS